MARRIVRRTHPGSGLVMVALAESAGERAKPADARLNQRGQQIIGKRFTLDTALVNGRGHMRVGDSSWPVVADDDLSAGTHVEVIAVEGITLRVKAC